MEPEEDKTDAGDQIPPLRDGHCPLCDQRVGEELFTKLRDNRDRMAASYTRAQASMQRVLEELQDFHLKLRPKPGRPLKPGVPGERISLGLKVTADIKSRLDEAARESGRTQSQEAEARLERSFDRQDLLTEVLTIVFGKYVGGILLMLGMTMQATVRFQRHEADKGVNQMFEGAKTILEALRTDKGDPRDHSIGRAMAVMLASALDDKRGAQADPYQSPFRPEEVEAVRSLVGPQVTARVSRFLLGGATDEPGQHHPTRQE